MKTGAKPSQHTMPQAWQPGRCKYNQIPRGRDQQNTDWTRRHQRTSRGGGQGRGGTKQGESEPSRSNPTHQKQRRAKQPRKRQQQQPKANRNPQHHEDTTKEAHRPKNTGHKGTIRAGRTNNRPQDTGPSTPPGKRQRTRKTPRRHRPTSQPQRQEAKRNTTTKRNELRSTSAPAQSADRHTSTKRIKIYLCGGRTEAKVRVYLSSLRACRQACMQVQKRSRP